jgi:3-hydroxyisobutyrate dehydrogenase
VITKKISVAVLGLGAMGLPMAARLKEIGPVKGFDPSKQRQELAGADGIELFATAREAATDTDCVILAVRNLDQLEASLFGAEGIADVLATGASVIVTSTIGVEGVLSVAKRLEARGINFVDAPISGGPVRARAGDLLIVVGAGDEAFGLVEPLLNHLASNLARIGPKPGDGQAMKTVNQLLCGVAIAAAAEALALAGRLGLDQVAVLKTLQAGAAESFMLGNRGPRMLEAFTEEGAPVLSRLDLFVKDMGIVTSLAKELGMSTPVAAATEQLYVMAESQGLGSSDDSSIIRVVDYRGR